MEKYFKNFKKYAFRLELLQKYSVDEERQAFEDFQKTGKIKPEDNEKWHKILLAAKKRNAKIIRVHVIEEPLTDYLRFELEHYRENEKYEEKIILISKEEFDKLNTDIKNDFWIFDDKIILEMNYDLEGHFLGFSPNKDVKKYLDFKRIYVNKD